jgi:hypothetical protein
MTACGGGGSDGQNSSALGSCGIRAEVSGLIAIQFTGKDDAVCATEHSLGSGLNATFIGIGGKGTLELTVDAVIEAETGSNFPTHVVITGPEKEHWQRDNCVTSISEHRLLNRESSSIGELRHYQVSAEGTCKDTIGEESPGPASTTFSPFAFRAEFIWRD